MNVVSVEPEGVACTASTIPTAKTRPVTSTNTSDQNLIDAINARRNASSTRKTAVHAPSAAACGQVRRPNNHAPRASAIAIPPAVMTSHACKPARMDGSERSRTVSESPTSPLTIDVATTMTPNSNAYAPNPSIPRYRNARNWSTKLPIAWENGATTAPGTLREIDETDLRTNNLRSASITATAPSRNAATRGEWTLRRCYDSDRRHPPPP